MDGALLELFEGKVELIPFSTCHWWVGCVTRGGYGQMWTNGKNRKAHRVAYELYIGEIPEGLLICHTCDTPLCVNPRHLFAGTHKDNHDDMMAKNRGNKVRGEAHGSAKLTEVDVLQIRELAKTKTRKEIASMFNVGEVAVSRIARKLRWKHI